MSPDRPDTPAPTVTSTKPLTERIAERFGADADPRVTLDPLAQHRASSLRADLVRRLSGEARADERYSVVREVARGGMGAVYEVWDDELRRSLAMKVALVASKLRAGVGSSDLRNVGRFLAEAQVTAQLEHPGIVPVHEVGLSSDGQLYYTMPLVRGRDLRTIFELCASGTEGWSRTRALGVLLRVCEAMGYAHSRGVIHRDLKPGNVMVGDFGEVYVMDWGLARVHEGAEDSRADESRNLRRLSTARDDARDEITDASLLTQEGDAIGTPCYMPPEQAEGRISKLGPAADVYAVGAMLHHLLAGRPPYVEEVGRNNGAQILERVIAGPPASLRELEDPPPAELVAICERAMARAPDERYADMSALGEDLRAFLEQRVVKAYEAGRGAELRKWVLRNKKLAIASAFAVATLLVGLIVSSILFLRAEKNARDVFRLASIQDYRDLVARADGLWPATRANVPAFEAWLVRARALIDGDEDNPGVAQLRESLAALRERAHPRTEAQIEAEILACDEGLEVLRKRRHVEWLRRSLEGKAWGAPGEVEALRTELPRILGVEPADIEAAGPVELHRWAKSLTAPDRAWHGYEAFGLELARRAAADPEHASWNYFRATLAGALVANGELDEGEAVAREVIERDPVTPKLVQQVAAVRAALAAARDFDQTARRAELADVERELSALTAKLAAGTRDWTFDDTKDRWWHGQLTSLVADLEWLEDPRTGLISGLSPEHGFGVRRRLEWARGVRESTVDAPDVAAAWRAAIESIADRAACPRYAGLRIVPQVGLVPLGRDARSGLWEFVDLSTGGRPASSANGVVPDVDMGVVFVLLPGGSATIGAQTDPAMPRHDPHAQTNEKPGDAVQLAPFFLSKYEMTQAQWLRVTGANPSLYARSEAPAGLHPVEQVGWEDCRVVLERLGFVLPTEAQWEYAARGGTDSVFWTGDEPSTVARAGNLADRTFHEAKRGGEAFEPWTDDYVAHAPVGRFDANPFGLHDVCGNVQEWCRDGFGAYSSPVTPGDGERRLADEKQRILRGGGFDGTAIVYARSAARISGDPLARLRNVGIRPARRLEP
jgi:formylglycine-generating enzyme required for sulfatase activity/serine/threonine protein kinase